VQPASEFVSNRRLLAFLLDDQAQIHELWVGQKPTQVTIIRDHSALSDQHHDSVVTVSPWMAPLGDGDLTSSRSLHSLGATETVSALGVARNGS
jgi:hypothetical protein